MALLVASPSAGYIVDMRIVIGTDQFWPCYKLAAAVLRRMTASDDTRVAECFATAAKGPRLKTEGICRLRGSRKRRDEPNRGAMRSLSCGDAGHSGHAKGYHMWPVR